MRINRYTQAPVARFNPFTMQEMAYTPSLLRQRHDEVNQSAALIKSQLGQIDVLDDYGMAAQSLISPLEQEINELSTSLAEQGVTRSGGVNKVLDLADKQSQLFSPMGGIGQLENATQQFRAKQQEIQEFFKDKPEIARHKLAQLQAGQADIDPITGKVKIGALNVPQYVKHIEDAEIMKQLNDVAKGLKASDLGDLGLTGIQNVNSFDDILTFAEAKQLDPQRIMDAMMSMVGPEMKQSIVQYGEVMGLAPEEALGNFQNRVANLASASGYRDTNRQRIKVTDDAALAKYKAMSMPSGLTTSPGPFIPRDISDTLKQSGLEFDESGNNIIESKSFAKKADEWFSGESGAFGDIVGNAIGYNMFKTILNNIPSINGRVLSGLARGDVSTMMMGIEESGKNKEVRDKVIEQHKDNIKKDMTESVSNFKAAYPEMQGMSNKAAYEMLTNARNEFAGLYSDVIAPQDADFSYINKQILGGTGQTGDFERRQIFVNDQKIGIGSEFYKKLGYKSFAEFKENGMPQIETGVTFGAKSPAAFVGNAVDSEGNSVTFTVQSNKEFEAAGRIPNKLLQYVQEGKIFSEMDNVGSVNELGIPLDEGNSMYFFYDLNRNQPLFIEAPKEMTPQQLKQYYEANPESSTSFPEAVNAGIQQLFYGTNAGNILSK